MNRLIRIYAVLYCLSALHINVFPIGTMLKKPRQQIRLKLGAERVKFSRAYIY